MKTLNTLCICLLLGLGSSASLATDIGGIVTMPNGEVYRKDGEENYSKLEVMTRPNGDRYEVVGEDQYVKLPPTDEQTKEENAARWKCASHAGQAKTEYAAQQIEKTCLVKRGYKPEPEPEPEPKGWFDW